MPGTLFLVATPIGNLEDITLRGLRILREAGLIAAEDTRRTAGLLAHYGITTPVVSFHEHSGPAKLDALMVRLAAGTDVALVSDAGTPLFSDPGLRLVQACIAANVRVDPIPGACAPVTAAVASGFDLSRFLFLGFAPTRTGERRRWLESLAILTQTVVFFESPHRIKASLADAAETFGNRQICLARELTKLHQEFIRGSASEVLGKLGSTKGEFTLVVDCVLGHSASTRVASPAVIAEAFINAIGDGHGRRSAIALVAKEFGVSSKKVYQAVEDAKVVGLMTNSSGDPADDDLVEE